MAATPLFKVYDAHKVYQAASKEIEAAAVLMGLYGEGATIRYGHGQVVWTEGAETQPATESYDFVAELVYKRIGEMQQKAYDKVYPSPTTTT